MSILRVNSRSIDQESGEIWTVQTDLQQIYPKSDRFHSACNYLTDRHGNSPEINQRNAKRNHPATLPDSSTSKTMPAVL